MEVLMAYMKEIRDLAKENVFIVGGFVRDYLINRKSNDVDFVMEKNALKTAKEFANKYGGSFVLLDEAKGVARVVMKEKGIIMDFSNMKGRDILEDLHNRDFTINAMAIKIEGDMDLNGDKIIDPVHGREDLENRVIRGIKEDIFKEDPLRMLRAVRFMAELDFQLDERTAALIVENACEISSVPGERITYELFHILNSHNTYNYFKIMDGNLDLLENIFPEIKPMKEVGQCDYHVVDAWVHSLYTLKEIEEIIYADGYFEDHLRTAYEEHTSSILAGGHSRLQLIKLAALFHDIGKPAARWVDEGEKVRFRGHEMIGMEIIAQISERLKLSTKEKKFLMKMVKEHMWPLDLYKRNDVSGKSTYDLFRNFGEDTLDILLIALADIMATRRLLNPQEEMGIYKIHVEYLANSYLTRFKDIINISHIISGGDIIENFPDIDPRIIAELLEEVRKAIFFGKIPANGEKAMTYIKEEILN